MNYGTRKAALSNFNVEQSQLDVDGVPFATGGNGSIHPSGEVPRNCSGYQVSQRGFAGVVQEVGADVVQVATPERAVAARTLAGYLSTDDRDGEIAV